MSITTPVPGSRRAGGRDSHRRPPVRWSGQRRGRRRLGCPRSSRRPAPPTSIQSGTSTCLFEYHGEFADFDSCGFGAKPVQDPHPPIFFSGLKDPKRSANRIAKYDLSGWIGIQDAPEELASWRGRSSRSWRSSVARRNGQPRALQHVLVRDHRRGTDQSNLGKGSNILIGTEGQITDNLKRLKEVGLTMPLIWPPFTDVPVSKTLDDLKRLNNEILPKVNAA